MGDLGEKPAAQILAELTDADWFPVGRGSAREYADRQRWLFRRVESIEFVGRRSVVRSISVDFEMPCCLPDLGARAARGTMLVPISVFQKWPPLMDFNFIGPKGHPVSLYRRATNKKLDFGLLLGMADRALALAESPMERSSREAESTPRPKTDDLPEALRRELAVVVASPRPSQAAVADAANRLRAELERRLGEADEREEVTRRIAATVDLAGLLAGSSILWVPVTGTRGSDRIVRFSYLGEYAASRPDRPGEPEMEDPDESDGWWRLAPEAWWRRFLIASSWRQRTLLIPLPHAGRFTRYHLDIRAPHGSVELVEAKAVALPPAGAGDAVVRSLGEFARRSRELDVPDEWVGPASTRFFLDYGEPQVLASTALSRRPGAESGTEEASAEIVDRRAHIYLGARSAHSHRVLLQLKLAATRQGFIAGCVVAAAMIAVLMLAAYLELGSAALNLEPTVVLLAAVPVVLGYVLVRRGEHELERYHIAGVRSMAMLSGAMPILGALTLVLTQDGPGARADLTQAEPIWLGLLIISWLTAAGLAFSWIFAASPGERGGRADGSASRS